GTSMLMMYRATPTTEGEALPTTGAIAKQLEGPGNSPSSTKPVDQPVLSAELIAGPEIKPQVDPENEPATGKPVKDARLTADNAPGLPPSIEGPRINPSVYPSTNLPSIDAAAIELPRLRTAEPPTAVAELSGQIHEPTPLQAQHDDHESRLH